jgi:hypothetical protein
MTRENEGAARPEEVEPLLGDRRARLARAMRENLRRRKEQQRGRTQAGEHRAEGTEPVERG